MSTREKEIHMEDGPPGLDIQFWPGYGFVMPSKATTNGSFHTCLSLVPEDWRAKVIEWAESVAPGTAALYGKAKL